MLTLNYTYTKEDYAAFFNYMLLDAPGKKKAKIKSHLKYFLYFSFLLLLIKLTSGGAFEIYFFFSIFMLACIYVLPLFTLKNSYAKLIQQFTLNPLNENFFSKFQVSFSEQGIFARTDYAETKYYWSSIVKKEEDKNFYFLYLTTEMAIQVPKRVLKSEVERKQLEFLFGQHLSFNAEVGHLVKE